MASSDRERAELIHGVYRNTPVAALAILGALVVLTAAMAYLAPERRMELAVWLGVSALITAWQMGLWAWHKRAPGPDGDWPLWGRRLTLAAAIDGGRWGLGSILLPAAGQFEQQMWVCMVVGGASCAQVASIGAYTPAFYVLLATTMLPYFAWAAWLGEPRYIGVAVLGMMLSCAIAWLALRQGRTLSEALRLRFENLDLAESLAEQKELADRANLAKTQFLAAASHDLRQPLHALGLFVAALSRTRQPPEGERLVGQITETVDALGGLFGTLLDVSQLDAGIVAPERRTFEIAPLLARLCREAAVDLAGRPVELRQMDCRAVVDTDPVLLERMLRNLLANAVRHTARGRILVGCRRRGRRLSVEVWDTGPGIAPEHQAAVFEEYYQLGNPERDRAKGLGLGLAITRRLSVLLDCPLELRSQLGRGSMFGVSVPLERGTAQSTPPPAAWGLRQGLIYVIDDEVLVQQSMAQLLEAWGYAVVAAGSADALLAARARAASPPDLVICDWRLRGEETALGAIARVRAAYGAETPALLITGDTAPERLRAAHATGLVLLHKPVAPGKLRAAVGNLIARRPVEAVGAGVR